MTDIQRITMIPATYLSRGSNQVSSFDLLKFIECLHLARGKLSGPEASLLHCLIMRGWTNGTFRVPQSILSLQTGLTTRTISRTAKVFEAEGLIRRVQRRNRTTEYALLTCDWTERAQHLFWYDEVREKAIDAFVQQAWRHSKREDSITEASGAPQEPTDSQQPAAMKPLEAEVPDAAQPQDPWTEEDLIAIDELLQSRAKPTEPS